MSIRSFRLVCAPDQIPHVEALLRAEGFAFRAEPFFDQARTLTAEPWPLGRSLAARFGYVYIQDKSSMLPPLALAPGPGDVVLDLCASPGSKTGILSSQVGQSGLVLANEPSPDRLATLRVNMRHLGCFNVLTCKYEAQKLPVPDKVWPYILLDAPCSGWGTVSSVARRMWSEEKTGPLEALQRALLTRAARLLAPGGRLLYSTCTTNVRENEDQVCFAQDHLGLSIQALVPFPGFSYAPSLPGCLRVEDDTAQGFFLACLTRPCAASDSGGLERESGPRPVLPGERIVDFAQQTGLDNSFLPEHEFLNISGRAYLILDRAREVLPPELRWQGFCVGGVSGEVLRVDPQSRLFVPSQPDRDALVLDEPALVRELLSGQSMPYAGTSKRRALYYRDLPLGFLTVKGRRCLWSGR